MDANVMSYITYELWTCAWNISHGVMCHVHIFVDHMWHVTFLSQPSPSPSLANPLHWSLWHNHSHTMQMMLLTMMSGMIMMGVVVGPGHQLSHHIVIACSHHCVLSPLHVVIVMWSLSCGCCHCYSCCLLSFCCVICWSSYMRGCVNKVRIIITGLSAPFIYYKILYLEFTT